MVIENKSEKFHNKCLELSQILEDQGVRIVEENIDSLSNDTPQIGIATAKKDKSIGM